MTKINTDGLHDVVLKVREANLTKQGLEHVIGVVFGYLTNLDNPENLEVSRALIKNLNAPGGVESFLADMKAYDLQCYGEPEDD